ncbi:putative membrane metal-binding protein [Sphaerochaeta pleomorpha str. Grapes]|uniref:Putative membrane metal-binding protein n=1 Tax=Sphaerochaeta pleomorpha (strain ATCC BAA-1885 / DSM 22778 / Grapes) TaxID=158190 RepID=G8QXR9_SPHPG|nr:ComEC/Rec2 family competence protein [Sphaerochaeta pleomorpha]AEV30713.1 putative membrane metal-binding protein [Sphaerochaeta pleomorpha str. Grapes]
MNGTRFANLSIALLLPVFFYLSYISSDLLFYPVLAAMVLGGCGFLWVLIRPDLKKTICLFVSSFYLGYALFGFATTSNRAWFCFPKERIVALSGNLVEDSSLTETDKQLLRLSLTRCTTRDGSFGSARGTIAVLCPLKDFFVSGSSLSVKGTFSQDGSLFFGERYQIEHITRLGYIRQMYMTRLENRLFAVMPDSRSRSLSMMLLLGRSSDDAFPLKKLGMESGCAFILALSGMHLQFFSVFSSFLFIGLLGKRRGKFCSLLIPVAFVLFVGPKPSLIRALGMYGCSRFLQKNPRSLFLCFWVTAMCQALLFPQSLQSMGCLLSYVSFSGLLCSSLLWGYCPPYFKNLISSLFAIVCTAPICLQVTGKWQLSSIIVGPLASALVALDMFFSLLTLFFGVWFSPFAAWCCTELFTLLEFGSNLVRFSLLLKEYYVYLAAMLTCLASIGYAKRALQRKRRRSYELEFCIRFPDSYRETT